MNLRGRQKSLFKNFRLRYVKNNYRLNNNFHLLGKKFNPQTNTFVVSIVFYFLSAANFQKRNLSRVMSNGLCGNRISKEILISFLRVIFHSYKNPFNRLTSSIENYQGLDIFFLCFEINNWIFQKIFWQSPHFENQNFFISLILHTKSRSLFSLIHKKQLQTQFWDFE
jgi:hypothetical protein